ncbi:PPOX class F420-dependent oxidoreductase [Mycobacterium deserti]|uniref:PPOX class F420-dependent oxidoreductase n=1 Tax=Mycobacterium deserti TaxID=2978347 RepID=A0ABT2MDV0_9MYCO|nr:PPOX class F420-dependent oxidoreductase [Mycobacterium deserti]MCT7660438.1 PPOX class F420-dependent oxidoreductase [Mycobacterium deserti]
MAFSDEEVAFLRSQPIARLATVNADGQPDVVPVAFEVSDDHIWIGGVGAAVLTTRKFRNIGAGRTKVSLVVDDLLSVDPFVARSMRVYGDADPPVERTGLMGPGLYSRITPKVSWSWNLAGEPAGEQWYPAKRTVHEP